MSSVILPDTRQEQLQSKNDLENHPMSVVAEILVGVRDKLEVA